MNKILLKIENNNLIISLLAVIVQGTTSLLIAFYINSKLGAEYLGLFSLLISFASVVTVSDFGLGQSIIHYGKKHGVAKCQITTQVVLTLATLLFILLIYFPVSEIIKEVIFKSLPEYKIKYEVIIIMMSIAIGIIGRVSLSSFTALQAYPIGQFILLISYIIYAISSIFLIPTHGILGACFSHLIMTSTILVLGQTLLIIKLDSKLKLSDFSFLTLKDMYKHGLNIQLMGIFQILTEPLVKSSLGMIGDLASLGAYELASKIVLGIRDLTVRPLGYLSGEFSKHSNSKFRIRVKMLAAIKNSFYMSFYYLALSITAYFTLSIFYPIVISDFFFYSYFTLLFGWTINVMLWIPTYHYYIGIGENKTNLISLFLIFLFVLLGIALSIYTNIYALIASYSTGIVLSSILAYIITIRSLKIPLDPRQVKAQVLKKP